MTQRPKAKRRRFVINETPPMQKEKPRIMEVDAANTHGESSKEIRSTNAEQDALCTQQTRNLVVKLGHQLGKLRAVKRENNLQHQDEALLSDDDVICLTRVEAAKTARSRANRKRLLKGTTHVTSCVYLVTSSSTLWTCVKVKRSDSSTACFLQSLGRPAFVSDVCCSCVFYLAYFSLHCCCASTPVLHFVRQHFCFAYAEVCQDVRGMFVFLHGGETFSGSAVV